MAAVKETSQHGVPVVGTTEEQSQQQEKEEEEEGEAHRAIDKLKIFDSWKFYKKRMIRILPVYYLGHGCALIAMSLGYEQHSRIGLLGRGLTLGVRLT